MPRIPKPDYNVPETETPKLFAVTYTYEQNGEWYGDTWHLSDEKCIGDALDDANEWFESQIDSGKWTAYEITNINLIRRGV